jgi:chlorobactene glucosyltransferase
MHTLLDYYSLILVIAGCWFVLLSASNAIFFKLSRRRSRVKDGPMISVLIPARNEEQRIRPTLDGIMDQEYTNYEVIVIDDNSTDETWETLEEYADKYESLKILKGKPLPEGWKGKPFAMTQLAEQAEGELFVFVDADIYPSRDFLSWVAERMKRHKADSMSAYARHRAKSVREYIFFPLLYLVNMTFLPFWLIKFTKLPLFSHAIGQLMIFRRDAYEGAGGFAVVFDKILEDIQMGRAMKSAGYRHVFLDARKVLSGYMYDSWEHTVSGLKRSIYEYFDKKAYPLVILTVFIFGFLVLPAFLIPFSIIDSWPKMPWIIAGNLGILIGWAITIYDRRLPWYVPLFYPIQFLFILVLAWKSLLDDVSGRGYNWKDRKVL